MMDDRAKISKVKNPIAFTTSVKQPPDASFPSFLCRPDFVVGMPVVFEMLRFAAVTPVARFHENESPGMPVLLPFFLGMLTLLSLQ